MSEKDRKEFFDNLEEHSKVKLMILDEYIKPWMRKVVLNPYGNSKCLIVDTFAGTGIYADGSYGSPLIIINEALNFINQAKQNPNMKIELINLVFVESDIDNYKKLKKNIEKHLNVVLKDDTFNAINQQLSIGITNSTHEEFLQEILSQVDNMIPSFFFIDPFKISVPFDLNKKLLEKYNNVELLFNLITEELSRFAGTDSLNPTLKKLYGIDNLENLKENLKDKKGKERINVLTSFYKRRLIESGASYTLNFDIQRENRHYKMSLIYATKSLEGFDTMKEVLNKLSSEGTSDFEYLVDKNPNQMRLELYPQKTEIILEELSDYIYQLFSGQKVLSKNIKNEIKKHPYIPSKYYNKAMIRLLEKGKIILVTRNNEKKVRKNSFPEDSYIEFSISKAEQSVI